MKVRLLPVFTTLLVTLGLLFGGWYAYQSYAVKMPLNDSIKQIPGIASSAVNVHRSELEVHVTLYNDANVRSVYDQIRQTVNDVGGGKSFHVVIDNKSSEELDAWWSTALFDIAQAMETKQYARVPEALQEHASDVAGLQVDAQMDDENVYVRLIDGDHVKFVVLPRTPDRMEAWSQ